MRQEVLMPKLGHDMEEGTVEAWLVEPGQNVERGEVIAEIETEKSVMEMESLHTGQINELVADVGQTCPVGHVIAYMTVQE